MEEWLAVLAADKPRPLLQNSLLYITLGHRGGGAVSENDNEV